MADAMLNVRGSGDTLAAGQISAGTTATLVAAARPNRRSLTIINGGTTDVFLGPTGVTVANGFLLAGVKGQSVTIATAAAVYAVVGTGSQTVSFAESF
jgi:hypothetical protein